MLVVHPCTKTRTERRLSEQTTVVQTTTCIEAPSHWALGDGIYRGVTMAHLRNSQEPGRPSGTLADTAMYPAQIETW